MASTATASARGVVPTLRLCEQPQHTGDRRVIPTRATRGTGLSQAWPPGSCLDGWPLLEKGDQVKT